MLHSPVYRARYADYLKSDFARIPLPGSRALFEALVPIGTELVALHLLDADALPILKDPKSVRLAGSGEARVTMPAARFEKDAYQNGRMYIAANQSRWFETVPQVAADFHIGGYRPARKWLKDRAAAGGKKASPGRLLTDDDILHYRRMIVALTRTAELMPQIDAVVEAHGGWPGAFRGMTDDVKRGRRLMASRVDDYPGGLHAFVRRGPRAGTILFPHLHADGAYVVSKTRFETDYIPVKNARVLPSWARRATTSVCRTLPRG